MSDLPQKWDFISKEKVLSCNIFDIFSEKFQHPIDGRSGEFFILEQVDWVQVIAIDIDGNLILVRQFRFGSSEISLEIPGGLVDGDEDYLDAAKRELLEETGYAGDAPILLKTILPNPAFQRNKLHIVLIKNCKKIAEQNLDPNEEISCEKLSIDECKKKIISGEINHGITLVSLLLFLFIVH